MNTETVVIGVASAVIGAGLNQAWTTYREWRKHRDNGRFTAMMLAYALESFASKCADARATYESYCSSGGASGEPDAQIPILPEFPDKMNWRSLGMERAAEVVTFRARVENARGYLSAMWEQADAGSGWPEVAAQAVELGVAALGLAGGLRKDFKLSPPPALPGWDIGKYLAEQADKVTRWREMERQASVEMWEELTRATDGKPAPVGPSG